MRSPRFVPRHQRASVLMAGQEFARDPLSARQNGRICAGMLWCARQVHNTRVKLPARTNATLFRAISAVYFSVGCLLNVTPSA